MKLPEMIRKARGEMTVLAFAKRFDVTRAAVYMWESGAAQPSPDKLAAMGITKRYEMADGEENSASA